MKEVVNWMFRGIIIFLISASMMTLFWFHSFLYQYGLLILMVFGGLGITALVLTLNWLTRPHKSLRKRCKSSIYLSSEVMTKVIFGRISLIAVPLNEDKPPGCGSICVAKLEDNRKPPFANVAIKNVRRKIVGDLDSSDLEGLGFSDFDRFQENTENSGQPLSKKDEVCLVEFEILDKGRF